MSLADHHVDRTQIKVLGQQHDFFSYLLPASKYPVSQTERPRYLDDLDILSKAMGNQQGGAQEILFQVPAIHHEAASKQISKYGSAWVPVAGVGVWPHKPSPTLWSVEEFEQFVPGEVPRPPIFMVFRLKGKREQCASALPLMGGRGVLIIAGLANNPDQFYEEFAQYCRSFITDPLYLAYPFFFPLLDAGTLPAMPPERTSELLGQITYYVRESPEDHGIVIFSRHSLEPLFKNLGFETDVVSK